MLKRPRKTKSPDHPGDRAPSEEEANKHNFDLHESALAAPHPLDGAIQKIARARAHYVELADALASEIVVSLDQQLDLDSEVIVVRAVDVPSFSPDLAMAAADLVQNLRSALNYTVWELARLNLERSGITREPSPITQFPIDTSLRTFSKKFVDDLSEEHIAKIKSFQPSQADPLAILEQDLQWLNQRLAGQAEASLPESITDEHAAALISRLPLARLKQLSNVDKHRALQGLMVAQGDTDVSFEGEDCEITATSIFMFAHLVDDLIIARLGIKPTGANPHLSTLPRIIVRPDFGGASFNDIAFMIIVVEQIVHSFRSEFD